MRLDSFCIPAIDFARAESSVIDERTAVARAVRAAGRETGMFFATNHGVPNALIAAHFDVARAFFGLPLEEKRAIDVGRSNCFRGYESFATQTIDRATPGDLKEGFIMGPDLAADHPHVRARYPNTGTNLWPRRPAGFRAHMERYVDAMNAFGRRIAMMLARSLDLADDYFSAALAEPLTYSQLLRYPAVAASAFDGQYGAGAHSDFGMITILLQDDVGGLEVRSGDGTWHTVAPLAGAFVVIFGELVFRLTDGLYRAPTHRVARNTGGRSRYAMPTFVDPDYDYRIECVPTCTPRDRAPRFPACTVGEHMVQMARGTLSGLRLPTATSRV
jgi:isopenicillin N synthase-like dioxygenase